MMNKNEVLKQVIQPIIIANGFKRISYPSCLKYSRGWMYIRVKNELSQNIVIEISGDSNCVYLTTDNDIDYGKSFGFNNDEEFYHAIKEIGVIIERELIPFLDNRANRTDRFMREDELHFYHYFTEYENRMLSKCAEKSAYSVIEKCEFLDKCVEESKALEFEEAKEELFHLGALFGNILLQFSDTSVSWSDEYNKVIVTRTVSQTGYDRTYYNRFPLLQIYKMWRNRKFECYTIQFLQDFLTNVEIMDNREICDALVRIGKFDVSRGY